MTDLYFLSFRDLQRKRAGPVLGAQVFRARAVDGAYDWVSPAFENRRRTGRVEIVPERFWAPIFSRKHLRFVIHGFNVNRDDGFMSPGAVAQELHDLGVKHLDPPLDDGGMVVPVLWPGDWLLPVVNYPFEWKDARSTAKAFAKFLTHQDFRLDRISFVTHSFGVRVALETMRETLASPDGDRRPDFDTAIFMASADINTVLDRQEYGAVVESLRKISVVSSRSDKVLKWAFPLGNAAEEALWRNRRPLRPALGRTGPKLAADSIACGKTDWRPIPDGDGVDHGHYLPLPRNAGKGGAQQNGWTRKTEKVLTYLHAEAREAASEWPPSEPCEGCPPGR